MVVRNRTVLQKSSPIFHHFCFPLHITRGDDVLKLAEVRVAYCFPSNRHTLLNSLLQTKNICGLVSHKLQVYHVNLEVGDVVITATDGLFDNLYEKEIVSIVCRLLEQGLEPQVLNVSTKPLLHQWLLNCVD